MYNESFSRNIGILTNEEQEKLKNTRVAIGGLGGVGGTYAMLLARMGFGKFHIADFDTFEEANINRQAGAYRSTLGLSKAETIRRQIIDINPEAEVHIFADGIQTHNIDAFLRNVDIVMDGIDFFAIQARRLLFTESEKRGLHIVTSGPLGFTTTLHVFGPGCMPSETYFDYKSCSSVTEELISFMVGVAPALYQLGQVDVNSFSFKNRKAASIGSAIYLCGGVACTEACKIVLGRKNILRAPAYLQFDPTKHRMKKGRLWFGNRGPIQRLKRWVIYRLHGHR